MKSATKKSDPKPALLTGLAPIARADARVLILGSMPGIRSLEMQQYYAHPQNRFWPIMGQLFGIGPDLPYAERSERLRLRGIAVWDVLRHCEREGSLDTRIRVKTEIANDFSGFLATHHRLETIFFNGRKAEASFRRHVVGCGIAVRQPQFTLPSTSPANASLSFERRLQEWRRIAERLNP